MKRTTDHGMHVTANERRHFHHFTVDVEEYFHAGALEPYVDSSRWDAMESRVAESVDRILDLLADADARGTFFVLGWVAERCPSMVKRIAENGHEVGSHGWKHRRVTELTRAAFSGSVRRSKALLEDLVGREVVGFRAPNFSIVPGSEWALDVLLEEGYRYDSSIYPIRRPGYGYPSAKRTLHRLPRENGTILEFPPATLEMLGRNLPAGGGAYFRILPYALVRTALRAARASGESATFYIHPWELDPDQPRLDVPVLTRVRQYGGLERVTDRMRRLLREFRFEPLARTAAMEGALRPANG